MTTSKTGFEKKIFISRNLTPNSPLNELAGTGYEVFCESLIKISQIRFTFTPKTQWIFFSSRNAVTHFFDQNPEIEAGVKFGVMSPTSAKALAAYGKTPDFVGEGVDVTEIAKDFAKCVQNDTVLLPQAIDSLQTIQRQLSFTNNCFNLFVYKTSLRTDFEIPHADLLVFTSPSNVKAYFEKYKRHDEQKIIAIGTTTLNALKLFGIKNAAMPRSFDEQGLLEVILQEIAPPGKKVWNTPESQE